MLLREFIKTDTAAGQRGRITFSDDDDDNDDEEEEDN